jgi:flap endonuclease-1
MGLQIGNIIERKEIEFSSLKNRIILIDAFNALYQFLTTIRQPDGTPLMDYKGRVTSHLSGLFYRNINLLQEGIKLVYVFDGKAPDLKNKTKEKRIEAKEFAKEKYEEAKTEEDIDAMARYAKQTVSISAEMIEESKKLLKAMGIAIIQAPGEGEAQASYMASVNREVYAVASQDYDSLMFKAPILIQNLTLSRKRKTSSGFVDIYPQEITLNNVLESLGINLEQLICIGILSGTDYNSGGVKGIGPKKALKLVKEQGGCEKVFEFLKNEGKYAVNFDWKEVYSLILNPDVDKECKIDFPKIDLGEIKKILLEHDFSEDRINNQLEKLRVIEENKKQKTLF